MVPLYTKNWSVRTLQRTRPALAAQDILPAYSPRIVDRELDELLTALPALALEGAKGVGKTATAERRVARIHRLEDPAQRELAEADPAAILAGPTPVLLDEWQHVPAVWDAVRRAVDDGATPGRFLLTGSAAPTRAPTHSGAGRIVTVRMRPLALSERGIAEPTLSLRTLLVVAIAGIAFNAILFHRTERSSIQIWKELQEPSLRYGTFQL